MRYAATIAIGALITSCGLAAADEPLYEVQWAEEQGEGFVPYSGIEGHPSVASLYADDFTLEENAVVDRVGWFGYSDYWDNPDLTNFTTWEVWIFEGQGPGVEPGELVYQQTFPERETNPKALGPYGLFGATMYRHEVELAEPVALEAGQYWIGIGADAIDGSSDWWIWAQAPPGDETIARWIWDDEEWVIQGPDHHPDWPTYNVAFQIFGEIDDVIPGDLNGDGSVGVPDLLILINAWGDCADCDDCPADLTGDCTVGVPDLLILINNWG